MNTYKSYGQLEELVALICERILGMGTIIYSVGKDAKITGKANKFPSVTEPKKVKIIIQVKHTQHANDSCSDNDFKRIIKNKVISAVKNLKDNNEIDYYLLFANRKLKVIKMNSYTVVQYL